MQLKPIDACNLDLVAKWMSTKDNYQWLDFAHGTQILTPISLRIMSQRDIHVLRVFTSDSDDSPIGLVALSDIAHAFKTARLWYVLGHKAYAGQGYTTRAVSKLLTLAFAHLGLLAVNAWAVDQNKPSLRVLEHNDFHFVGRQRQCHHIDGHPFDRLLFDLLASEHKER